MKGISFTINQLVLIILAAIVVLVLIIYFINPIKNIQSDTECEGTIKVGCIRFVGRGGCNDEFDGDLPEELLEGLKCAKMSQTIENARKVCC